MNKQDLTPHYIAAFADNELRKGIKGVRDVDVNLRLDAIIRLFCCLHGRDVFISSYTKYLS
jgi:cullin 3